MMNNVRIIIGELFQSSMSNMSFPAYFNYVNTSGKITARSLMELDSVILTLLEAQEKVNQQNEENFKQIFEILAKIVEEKKEPEHTNNKLSKNDVVSIIEKPTEKTQDSFRCATCDKVFTHKVALSGHSRSHKVKI